MAARLHVGNSTWNLPERTDLESLKSEIFKVAHRHDGLGDWLTVRVDDGGIEVPVDIYLTPGVPVLIEPPAPPYEIAASIY